MQLLSGMLGAGVIIAGGRGERLGGDKPFRAFGGATLLGAVVERVRPQLDSLAVNIRKDYLPRCLAHWGNDLEFVFDDEEWDVGPLAGVLAALHWAKCRGAAMVATFPGDTPFLPRDLVRRLTDRSQGLAPAVASDGNRVHGLCAVWPASSYERLLHGVRNENIRSLRQAIAYLGGCECVIDCDPRAFFNVNTPEDLLEAERMASQAPQH